MSSILIIEDDATLLYDLAASIESWGHEVRTASNGIEGVRLINERRPNLVLCDINMAQGNGLELARYLAEDEAEYFDMVFILISAMTAPSAIVDGITAGADDYITKPIDRDVLRAKIESHLRKRKSVSDGLIAGYAENAAWYGLTHAMWFTGGSGVLGVFVFVFVYYFKSVLGINIFEDIHLSDLNLF